MSPVESQGVGSTQGTERPSTHHDHRTAFTKTHIRIPNAKWFLKQAGAIIVASINRGNSDAA
jgi:hypothetical protein